LVSVWLPGNNAMLEPSSHTFVSVKFTKGRGYEDLAPRAPDGRRVEAGVIGREGMTGLDLDRSPYQTFVQMKGKAARVDVKTLRSVFDDSPHLRQLVSRYGHTLNTQIAYTALANGRATIEERLARWLLMCEDRVGEPILTLTHEFLSLMLGVQA
jgi:CRP-like cAMP-binding protein